MMQPSIPLGETFQKTQPLIPHDSISLSCCFCHPLLGLKSISTHHKNLPKYKANSHAPRSFLESWKRSHDLLHSRFPSDPCSFSASPWDRTHTLPLSLPIHRAQPLPVRLALAISCFIYQNPASLSIQISRREASQRVLCKTKAQSLAKQLN